MFSKALFKQSCKANGTMWTIITFAVCFMLACVMLISGNGKIGDVKNSIQDTIITKTIDSQMEDRSLTYYLNAKDGLEKFDSYFLTRATETLVGGGEIGAAYATAVNDLQTYLLEKAAAEGYEATSAEAQEIVGSALFALNPNGMFDSFYTENGESIPEAYDVTSLVAKIATGEASAYLTSSERADYRAERAEDGAAVFVAGNMSKEETANAMADSLADYGVTREKYASFGYTYPTIKHMAKTAIVTFQGRIEYELDELASQYANGAFENEEAYAAAIVAKTAELKADVSANFLVSLPDTVSEAIEEIGAADLYTLVVGSIFYKLAGLLLPIIFVIMASNNLVAGQVDSGSMAYVLSTSTKRRTVVFTQAVYLIGSIFAMFSLTTLTGCICLAIITEEVALTYGKLILLNIGAFLVLFALSGLCFFTSCFFDRSKRSMAIGGGLSIFSLVAAMLGLFGSPVIPSVVRLKALNNFNYATVISLFDVISIMDGTGAFLWKFAILAVLGIIGYLFGAKRFNEKDLPL